MRVSWIMAVGCIAGALVVACSDHKPTITEGPGTGAHDHPGMNAAVSGNVAVPGGFTVQALARGDFPDDVEVKFKIKLNDATNVALVSDPSDALVARITFQPGGSVGWHTHHGPVIVTVASGALSIINASDCVHRVYQAGKAFVDPGQGNVHVGFNETAGETVIYATFLDVPRGQPATIPADDPGCAL
jgi:hypothetical protein